MINIYDNYNYANNDGDDYKNYANLTTELNRWILEPLGIWPLKIESSEVSWKNRFLRKGKNLIFYFLMIFVFVSCAPYVIFEVENFYEKLRLTGPLSFCAMAILKYIFLTVREEEIRCCVESIEMDWKRTTHFEEERIMIDKLYSGRRLVTICIVFTYGAAGFYYIVLPLMGGKVLAPDINVTYRPVPFPVASFLIDIRYSPANEIVIFIQCLYGFAAHSIAAGACSLAAVFTMHACGQLQVLMNWLKYLLDGREDMRSTVDERMASVIQRHVRTLKPLVYPVAKIIVDARRSPINEIFFGVQCVSGFLAHSITAAACGLAATFAMHACGQLQMVISYLENLVDGREDSCDTVQERLADIVQRHVRALK